MQNNTIRKMSLVLIICAYSVACAEVEVRITQVPTLPVLPEAHIVAAIKSALMRTPENMWEEELIKAGQRSFESVLAGPPGSLAGMSTTTDAEADILLSRWEPDNLFDLGFRALYLWDMPDFNWFVIKCDPSRFASADNTEAFLKKVLTWHFMPSSFRVQLRYAPESTPTFLAGGGDLPAPKRGGLYYLFGVRDGSETYLMIGVGKAYFMHDYPQGGAYVKERFPPLRDLVQSWSKGQILSEVEKTWGARQPTTYNNYRDVILISAAVQRGLTKSELEALLLPGNAPDAAASELRTSAVMKALLDYHQLASNRDAIEDITLRIDRQEGRFALQAVFLTLAASADFDGGDLALKCVATCGSVEPALRYLVHRGTSEAVYNKLKNAVVPAEAEGLRRTALEQIRSRIDKSQASR